MPFGFFVFAVGGRESEHDVPLVGRFGAFAHRLVGKG